MKWWPKFRVEVEVIRKGIKSLHQVFVQAPSNFRAEEFACYQFESDPKVEDFEVIRVSFLNP